MPEAVKEHSQYIPRRNYNRFLFTVAAAGASVVALAFGISKYSNAHESTQPIRLPAGTERLRSPDDNTTTFLVPTSAAEAFVCGAVKRPLLPDIHNSETVIAEIGDKTIVQCLMREDVPVIASQN